VGLGSLDFASGVYTVWAGYACGGTDGKCPGDNDLSIGPDDQPFQSADGDVSACEITCNSDVECGGFNYDPDEKKCYFRKNTKCNVVFDRARTCYTKPAGLPLANEVGNGRVPVVNGDKPEPKDGAGYSCALFPPSQVCSDGGGVACTVLLESISCDHECAKEGLRCLDVSANSDGCPGSDEAELLQEDSGTSRGSALLKEEPPPQWFKDFISNGGRAAHHTPSENPSLDPQWYDRMPEDATKSEYHLGEQAGTTTTAEPTRAPYLTCASPHATTCVCGLVQ
jgi:hypothetical protein